MKKVFLWIGKAIVGGILAFLILTLFCTFYYNVPVHSSVADGATDYAWEENKFYSRATEGFAWGKTNNEGYLNPYDYSSELRVDTLLLGSSHMEAYNVAMDESTAAYLSELCAEDVVYNIGTSAHTFLTCASNLESALDKYAPQKYVIIETQAVRFDKQALEATIAGEYEELTSHSEGIIGLLQKNPFFRLLYSQLSSWNAGAGGGNAATKKPVEQEDYSHLYVELLQSLSQTAKEHDVELIIVYHTALSIHADTKEVQTKNPQLAEEFATYCAMADVGFIDMTERFVSEYETSYILPHGFSNTSVGQGHLNKYGHKMIAEEIFKFIGGEE